MVHGYDHEFYKYLTKIRKTLQIIIMTAPLSYILFNLRNNIIAKYKPRTCTCAHLSLFARTASPCSLSA